MAKKFFSKVLSVGLSLALCAGMVAPAFAASFSELDAAIKGGAGGTDMGGGRYGYGDRLSQEGENAKYAIEAWNQDDTRHVQLNENVSKEDGEAENVTIDNQKVELDLQANTITSDTDAIVITGDQADVTINGEEDDDGNLPVIQGGENGIVVNGGALNVEGDLSVKGGENVGNGILVNGDKASATVSGAMVTGYENGVKVESGHADIKDGASVGGTKTNSSPGYENGGVGVLVDGDKASATISGEGTVVYGNKDGVRATNGGYAEIKSGVLAKTTQGNFGGSGVASNGYGTKVAIEGAIVYGNVKANDGGYISIARSVLGGKDYNLQSMLYGNISNGYKGPNSVIDAEDVIIFNKSERAHAFYSPSGYSEINVKGTKNKIQGDIISINLMNGAAIQLSDGKTMSLTGRQVKITDANGSEIFSYEGPTSPASVPVNKDGITVPNYLSKDGTAYADKMKVALDGSEETPIGATVTKTVDEDTGIVTIKTDNGRTDKYHQETTITIDLTEAKDEVRINANGTTTVPAGSKVQKGDSTYYPTQEVTMNKNGNVNWNVPYIEDGGSYVGMTDGENWTGVGLPEGEKAEVRFVDNGDGTLSAEVDVPAGSWTGDTCNGTYYPNDVTLGLDGLPKDSDTHHITMNDNCDEDDNGRHNYTVEAESDKGKVNLTVVSPHVGNEEDGWEETEYPLFHADENDCFTDGKINVPAGSAVTDEQTGVTTVYLDGATINPDGLIESNGNTVVLPQGEKPTVDVKSTTEDEDRGTVADEMEIDVPGGTKINKEDDETTCVGDCTLDQDGNVISGNTVTKDKTTGDVTIDDGKGGKTEVEVPDGGNADVKVNDDGTVTVTVPEGGKITDKDGDEIDLPDGGEIIIDKNGNVTLPKVDDDDDDDDNGGNNNGSSNVFENYDFGAGTTNIEDEAVPLAGIVFIQDVLAELYRRAGSPDGADAEGEYDHAVAWALANELIDEETDVEAVVTVAALRAILANHAKAFGANAVAAEDLTTLTGEDDDVVMNCDEVLAEFFGEEYVPAKDEEETAA